ncbi:hypothetical protein SynBIOSU31_02250 [Synechococcus sp. BIOS-U3-1]|nr:hypothetical protein SynBIOSU31_02250 [Synechococcus sp. BIOS-U3-1]
MDTFSSEHDHLSSGEWHLNHKPQTFLFDQVFYRFPVEKHKSLVEKPPCFPQDNTPSARLIAGSFTGPAKSKDV